MRCMCTFWICMSFLIGIYVARPVRKIESQDDTNTTKTEALSKDEVQDKEYFRYLTQVVQELEKDPSFKAALENQTAEDIKTGKIAEHIDLLGHKVRVKLDEVKRMEVEYQRKLLLQQKDHMAGIDRNYWNPIHHENKATFEKEDLKQLLSKHNDMMLEQDGKRKKKFKEYEMEKEHKRRQLLKNLTDEEKNKETKIQEDKHHKKHEKLHEPGHKAQMEEVWEEEDGLDPEGFDTKTFFNLHDKNSDGYLDQFELKTLFLHDLDKVYNETDPDTDPIERSEEMEKMREHAMKSMDLDKDGLVSFNEFHAESKSEEFENDEDWKPITDEDQYTEEELNEYENGLEHEEDEDEDDDEDDSHHDKEPTDNPPEKDPGHGTNNSEKKDEHMKKDHVPIPEVDSKPPVMR